MDKWTMREFSSELEAAIDQKLTKWKKQSRIEDKESLQINWLFNQNTFVLYVFGLRLKEAVHLQYSAPHTSHRYEWYGLTDKTFDKVIDRIGNLAQMAMYPLD